eukprot:3672473-Ditylum_brightwellii.AAC.1
MYLVTDGGTTDGIGYYRWVIATNCDVVITAHGQSTGYFGLMESLQTKSMSILAMVTFLHHFCKFHNITPNTMSWAHYCHNLTAKRRMQNHKHGYNHHPTVTTKPDFDVQLQIE